MQNSDTKDFWVHVLLFVLIVGILGAVAFLFGEIIKIKNKETPEVSTQNLYPTTVIEKFITPSPAGETTPVPVPAPSVTAVTRSTAPPQKITSYVPFSGSFSTTNTDWTDVPGTQAYVDLKNNYNANAYVTFEASIKADSGSEVFARLFDSTHAIAVGGSEISTASTSSTLVSSGRVYLWSGNNLYKVQIKSLNSFNVTFGSGTIKIVY